MTEVNLYDEVEVLVQELMKAIDNWQVYLNEKYTDSYPKDAVFFKAMQELESLQIKLHYYKDNVDKDGKFFSILPTVFMDMHISHEARPAWRGGWIKTTRECPVAEVEGVACVWNPSWIEEKE